MLDIREILDILPHRYPFILVDRILEMEDNKRAIGIKNVTINEPFFQGHFPGRPTMPGVIICEAMAQTGGIMLMASRKGEKIVPYLASINKFRFKKPVFPGDTLKMEVELVGMKKNMGKVTGKATVDGKMVAMGEMNFALMNEDEIE